MVVSTNMQACCKTGKRPSGNYKSLRHELRYIQNQTAPKQLDNTKKSKKSRFNKSDRPVAWSLQNLETFATRFVVRDPVDEKIQTVQNSQSREKFTTHS